MEKNNKLQKKKFDSIRAEFTITEKTCWITTVKQRLGILNSMIT